MGFHRLVWDALPCARVPYCAIIMSLSEHAVGQETCGGICAYSFRSRPWTPSLPPSRKNTECACVCRAEQAPPIPFETGARQTVSSFPHDTTDFCWGSPLPKVKNRGQDGQPRLVPTNRTTRRRHPNVRFPHARHCTGVIFQGYPRKNTTFSLATASNGEDGPYGHRNGNIRLCRGTLGLCR